MSKKSSKWAHWTQSKLCLVTQLFPFPEENEQRPAVEKKKNGTYFLPCSQWLNCRGNGEAGEKNILQGNTWAKKYPALKKISLMVYNAGKKILHHLCQGKTNSRGLGEKILTQTISPISPLRSQIVNPWVRFLSFTCFQQFLELVGPNNSTSI